MIELIRKIIEEMENGRDAVLCHILSSSGSTPRGAGARMIVWRDGSICGTVGGGEVEQSAIRRALDIYKTGCSDVVNYLCRPEDVKGIGMICGGEVLIDHTYYFHGCEKQLAYLKKLEKMLNENHGGWIIKEVSNNRTTDAALYDADEGLLFAEHLNSETVLDLLSDVPVHTEGETVIYAEPIVKRESVYIFGGGHVGRELVPVLEHIGFNVTVYDSREELAKHTNFPKAHDVICGDFGDIFSSVTINAEDYVVIMTPGHQSDRELLSQVLTTDASYIGCIGSHDKIEKTNMLLNEQGFTDADLSRVHSPIGLPIGGRTPEEIAISIAAEIIQHRSTRRR